MIAAAQLFNPGTVGFVAGGVLMVCAVGLLWVLFGGGRADAEAVAEVAPVVTVAPVPQPWHPSQGVRRRVDDATQLFARCSDDLDATMVHPSMPRQRAVPRG